MGFYRRLDEMGMLVLRAIWGYGEVQTVYTILTFEKGWVCLRRDGY